MKGILLSVLLLFASLFVMIGSGCAAVTPPITSPTLIVDYIRVWGYLKYFHPSVTGGKANWDSVFIADVPTFSSEPLDASVEKLLAAVGGVKSHGLRESKSDDSILTLVDMRWIDELHISANNKAALHAIFSDQVPRSSKTIDAVPMVNNPDFSSEDSSRLAPYPSTAERLLAIARYWNAIEYFCPNLNLIPNWTDTLRRYVPLVADASNADAYQDAMLQLCCSIRDGHSSTYGSGIRKLFTHEFGDYYLPLPIRYIDSLVVFRKSRLNLESLHLPFRPGDILRAVGGVPVETLAARLADRVPHSNEVTRRRNTWGYLCLAKSSDSIDISYERNGELLHAKMRPMRAEEQQTLPKIDTGATPWRSLTATVGFVNLDLLTQRDVQKMMDELHDKKAIIFDLRNYPHEIAWPLAPILGTGLPWARFSRPNYARPGSFIVDRANHISHPSATYKGKIVVLVDEQTQSQAEYTAMMFRTVPGCVIVGSQTAGADGNISKIKLPGDITTIFSGLGVYYLDGKPTQQIGIVPDIEVHPTIKGLAEGRDEVLERAIQEAQR